MIINRVAMGRNISIFKKLLRRSDYAKNNRIDELSAEETMNAKGEWNYIKLNKITMQT